MNKPTLLQLREKFGINTTVLANAAGVEPEVVYAMLVGRPVERRKVERVLLGLKKLTDVEFKLEDIDVAISTEQD